MLGRGTDETRDINVMNRHVAAIGFIRRIHELWSYVWNILAYNRFREYGIFGWSQTWGSCDSSPVANSWCPFPGPRSRNRSTSSVRYISVLVRTTTSVSLDSHCCRSRKDAYTPQPERRYWHIWYVCPTSRNLISEVSGPHISHLNLIRRSS